jgi:hypothetical protein
LAKVRKGGGVSHADVLKETRKDMEADLRRMVRAYTGAPRQAKVLLEALVIARKAGVRACDEIERALAERLQRPRAA